MNEMTTKLVQIYNALDGVTVKGYSNCAAIAGVMQMISTMIQEESAKGPHSEETQET